MNKKSIEKIRQPIYRWLREGRRGSRITYSPAAYLYWLASERTPYVGTRIIEIPWVLNQLRKSGVSDQRILQVGDVLLQKALDNCEIELVDMDAEESSTPGLRVYKADIREVSLCQGYFDIAISISTLEHIGVQEPRFPDGDKLAVEVISQALKPGGLFLFTVPFGKPVVMKTFRVYDKERLNFILEGNFLVEEENFFVWNKIKWQKTSPEMLKEQGFLKNNPSMNLGGGH